jgi:leader peptidase (prepilin peptidase) / N-methyltransferase
MTGYTLAPFLLAPLAGIACHRLVAYYYGDVPRRLWLWFSVAGICLSFWAAQLVLTLPIFWLSVGLAWVLLLLSAIDIAVYRLPDSITLPLGLAGLAVSWWVLPEQPIFDHALAAMLGFSALWVLSFGYRHWRGRDGLGLGDAKLVAVAGAWLGSLALPSVLLIASLCGLLFFCVAALRRGRPALSMRLAFGAPLALAIWITWLYGPLMPMKIITL